MTTDPFRCDTAFSVALLLAFCSLPTALFSVALPDWIVVSEKSQRPFRCSENGSDCFSEQNASVRTEAQIRPESGIGTFSATATTASTAYTTSSEDLTFSDSPKAEARIQTGRNASVRSVSKPVVIANFNYICVRRSNTKILECQPIVPSNLNESRESSECVQDGEAAISRSFEDAIECNVRAIRKSISPLVQYAFPSIISTATICTICTIFLDIFAVMDKGYLTIKVTAGMILLGSATIQIVILVELRYVVTSLATSADAEASQGSAVYFATLNCITTVIASALLFWSSYTERPPVENSSKSNADVPFQNNVLDSSDTNQDCDEFIKIQDDESEEWGFYPKANDMSKEVRSRLLSSDYPQTYHKAENITTTATNNKQLDEVAAQFNIRERNRNASPVDDDRSALASSFNSEEFLLEENKTSPAVDEHQQPRSENSVKRVVFLLPQETPEAQNESLPGDREQRDVTVSQASSPTTTNDTSDTMTHNEIVIKNEVENRCARTIESGLEHNIPVYVKESDDSEYCDDIGTNVDLVQNPQPHLSREYDCEYLSIAERTSNTTSSKQESNEESHSGSNVASNNESEK